MDTNPEDETSYTTFFEVVFQKYVGNEICAQPWRMSIIKPTPIPGSNLFPYANDCRFGQWLFDQIHMSSNDEE
jgi:hypothetical protein